MLPDPDPGLSPAALAVVADLEAIARKYPEASGPELALLLARRYCPVRLKRGDR